MAKRTGRCDGTQIIRPEMADARTLDRTPAAIEPARLSFDSSGAPFCERFGDVYPSGNGALGQSRAIFLGGTGLPEQWRRRSQFVILETGFGLGTNFLATWQAWRDDPAAPQRLHFVSIEAHPLSADALIHSAGGELPILARALADRWPLPLPGLHRCEFDGGRVVLTLAFGDARTVASRLRLGVDAFFLDGFAPDRNPQMWEPALIKALARQARPGARLATWCTAPHVQESLAASGFEIELAAGYGHKNQRLVARFAPRWKLRRHEHDAIYAGTRSAVVIGAGLAGCACADALARRGWDVTVIERSGVASGASALPWGLLHPHLAADDNRLARLTRAGCFATRDTLSRVASMRVASDETMWRSTGVFEVARDGDEQHRWRSALARFALPSAWCEPLGQDAAAERLGLRPRGPGIWWPQAAVVEPAGVCRAMLSAHPKVRLVRADARRMQACVHGWRVLDSDEVELARAPVVIAANAMAAPTVLDMRFAGLRAVRGRTAHLGVAPYQALRAPICGDGYLLRAPDGSVSVGSTYEEEPSAMVAALDSGQATASNLARVVRLLDSPPRCTVEGGFDGVRAVARDRLPLAGAIADETLAAVHAPDLRGGQLRDLTRRRGLYGLFALGSRGITLAPLLAELIACQIEGEPWPIEQDLAAAVDPARFLLQCLRQGTVRAR